MTPQGRNAAVSSYRYLGLGTIVKESRPSVSGGLNLDYDPNANDSFTGFDRFARVVDQLWANDAGTPIDRYKYGYDRAGNRTWKQNVAAVGKALDELYAYDQLDRLTNTQRGTLDFTDPDHPTITASKYQDWTLDGLGNFSQFDDNGTAQTREVNGANEITSTTGIATPTYDAAGNITSDGTLKYEYDAWNRQTAVRRVSDDSLVATYQYDGQNHRVTKTLADGTTTDYFYNGQWQIVEERTQSGAATAVNQYVWDQSYVDAPLVQFHDGNGDGQCDPATDATDTIRYYTSDANHNVTTTITVGHTSTETQHVAYDAYGKAKVYAADWTGAADPTADGPLYCGYWFDAETGNYLARNRYYTVALATWLSRDPIGFAGGDENLYRYVGSAPTRKTDPSGNGPVFPDFAPAPQSAPVTTADSIPVMTDSFGITWSLHMLAQAVLKTSPDCGSGRNYCFSITIWAPSYNYLNEAGQPSMAFGHSGFSIPGYPTYGFHTPGFTNDDVNMKGFGEHSTWECCGLSEDEAGVLENRMMQAISNEACQIPYSFSGEGYPQGRQFFSRCLGSPPFPHCHGQSAEFAAGLGLPNFPAGAGRGPGSLISALIENPYCRLKKVGPNFEKPYVYPKI